MLKIKNDTRYNLWKDNNRVLANVNSMKILGYLNNRGIIDLNKLYEDTEKEDKLWYDNGNDWRYEPKPIYKKIFGIFDYFKVEGYKLEILENK